MICDQNEIRIDVTLFNNRLHQLIFEKYSSVRDFAASLKMSPQHIGELLTLKKSPLRKRGRGYRRICHTIADAFFVDIEELFPIGLYKLDNSELSLEMRVEHLPFHECCEIETEENPFNVAEEKETRMLIQKGLLLLSETEKRVLEMRFGLNEEGREYTLDEVGLGLGFTRERIRQIEAKALVKLGRFLKILSGVSIIE